MEWVQQSSQIHSTFSNLGYSLPNGGYHINENCNSALESILENLATEDKYLRTYRRSISFGQNIKKDLIPLLINTKDDKAIELLTKIFVNLTIPVECLLSLELVSKTDIGRHTIFEINSLLLATKIAFTDYRVTKVNIEFLKKNSANEQMGKLSTQQCTNISNTLLILRNILHIPEDVNCHSPTYSGPPHNVQNQLIWNLFSQSIDKVLIKLMIIPDAINWGVTMVQIIALVYKDQHVTTLHKLLNIWLEASLSESSEDNESNTSPPKRGSDDSSPMLTSDPTSDSSDTGISGKCNGERNSGNNGWDDSSGNSETDKQNMNNAPYNSCEGDRSKFVHNREQPCKKENDYTKEDKNTTNVSKNTDMKAAISINSDCGYGTQMENQESISTSSNEDELPTKKPVHKKPHNAKQRTNNKVRPSVTLQERKRKKIVKRGKANIINVQGLTHNTSTDDDISNVLKEFTVDFLLKGYNSLVRTLHSQILTNVLLEIDTSHFFWLVTYFLKFATQIELDLEHVSCVLSFEVVSYLTAEGVNLCEQFELAIKLDGNDLKPSIRRLHLVVTAIREFFQAIEVYKKSAHICNNDKEELDKLQIKMCETDELRSLLVLLLRRYNQKYHSKQYLQDLIVTNHILLMFTDSVMKMPEYKGAGTIVDHIRQFCSPEIMYQYGLLLEDYKVNGEFVNDCIFTLMHHVGGEMDSLITLFQPKILKTFTLIWKSEFEICDDWSDLIEYVINTFMKKPYELQGSVQNCLDAQIFDNDTIMQEILVSADITEEFMPEILVPQEAHNNATDWTEDEISTLSWNYMQRNNSLDVVGEIVKMFKEDGIIKTPESVVKELYNQFIINKEQFDKLTKKESEKSFETIKEINKTRENEISKLCEQLIQDGKSKFLDWVQNVLLESCSAKIYLEKKSSETFSFGTISNNAQPFENLLQKPKDLPVISPVSYHSLLLNQSIPLVPWNCEQASICKDFKFLQLLHKLRFQMPIDSGKVFIRIPHFWTSDFLYEVAGKISSIDKSKLKFSLKDIFQSSIQSSTQMDSLFLPDLSKGNVPPISDNLYQIHIKKQNPFASIVNFTPMPGSSFTTEDEIVNKPSWLEMIQKSQEYKITLDSGKSIIAEDEDTVMKPVGEVRVTLEAAAAPALAKLPLGNFAGLAESDCCNNSVCETASVASDLTRMYVSDEDEKPEPPPRTPPGAAAGPLRAAAGPLRAAPGLLRTCDAESSGDDGFVAGKRPRVQFSSHF